MKHDKITNWVTLTYHAFLLTIYCELKAAQLQKKKKKTLPTKELSKGLIQSLWKSKDSCFGYSNGLWFMP